MSDDDIGRLGVSHFSIRPDNKVERIGVDGLFADGIEFRMLLRESTPGETLSLIRVIQRNPLSIGKPRFPSFLTEISRPLHFNLFGVDEDAVAYLL